MMASLHKLKQIRNETTVHFMMRAAAVKFLWRLGYRAIASNVLSPPYGVFDIVAVKDTGELFLIDCVENLDEFLEKNSNGQDISKELAEVYEKFHSLALTFGKKMNPFERHFLLETLSSYSNELKNNTLYWRMTDQFPISDYLAVFIYDERKKKDIESLDKVGIYRCEFDFKYGIKIEQKKAPEFLRGLYDEQYVVDMQKRMLRSLTAEKFSNITKNIIDMV